MSGYADIQAPRTPRARLCLGITGHREDNATYLAQRAGIEAAFGRILDAIAACVEQHARSAGGGFATTRLHSLLSGGADQLAANEALARGWELVAPLPFGVALNTAINAQPGTVEEARHLLAGDLHGCSTQVQGRATRIREVAARAALFELADRDDVIAPLLLAKLQAPHDARASVLFAAESSLRAAIAARVLIEQSDILIGIWDGATRALVGGTGHTIQAALEMGTAVVWIDARDPDDWRILRGPESILDAGLATDVPVDDSARLDELGSLVRAALLPAAPAAPHAHGGALARPGVETLQQERWPVRSRPLLHSYRRIETLFGSANWRARFRGLRTVFETPDGIAGGSAAPLLQSAKALAPPGDYLSRLEAAVLRRFAWADGVSAQLSDTYRGGMMASFLLAPLAVVGGIAYLPFASSGEKWMFALFELLLLGAILGITVAGRKGRWHARWLETRRVTEYLRHTPILLLLGVARVPARWPVGTHTSWPEWYARHAQREPGLPPVVVTRAYLRTAVAGPLHEHVVGQRDYHQAKARRLARVHHSLDRFSEILFALAVLSVAGYLLLKGGATLHLWPKVVAERSSYLFTFLGVLLPTFGGAIAGIRYFGDFERFAAISTATSEQFEAIHLRIVQLLSASDTELDYGRVSGLAHAMDDVTVTEIQGWQAVFAGKQVTVPV